MLMFDKEIYLSLLFQFILSEILSISLCGSEVLLFFEFMNIVSFCITSLLKLLYCCKLLSQFLLLDTKVL